MKGKHSPCVRVTSPFSVLTGKWILKERNLILHSKLREEIAGRTNQNKKPHCLSLQIYLLCFPRTVSRKLFPLNCYGNFSLSLIIFHTVCWAFKQNVRFPQNKPGTFRMLSEWCKALSIPQQASCTEDKEGVNTDDAAVKTGKQSWRNMEEQISKILSCKSRVLSGRKYIQIYGKKAEVHWIWFYMEKCINPLLHLQKNQNNYNLSRLLLGDCAKSNLEYTFDKQV